MTTTQQQFPSAIYPRLHSRTKKYVTLVVLFLVISAAFLGTFLLLRDSGIVATDSGVAACEQMANNAKAPKSSGPISKMTEAQHQEKRAPFANSQYADIKVAGTNVVDTIYKADQMGDDTDLGTIMMTATQLQAQWAQLQIACSSHGVELPNLNSKA